jgi:hypothetical protein
MVIYVQQGGTTRRRFNIYKWVDLVVDWEFAWSLQQQVLGGGLQMAFFLEAKLFRGWRASVEQRQAGSLRVGCELRAAGCWLLVEPGSC